MNNQDLVQSNTEYSPAQFLRFVPSRMEYLNKKVKQGKWNLLKNAILKYDPHVVILLARRSPRFFELFDWEKDFQGIEVISDFAVPFIADKITPDTKVAIIDDSLNHGTTLLNLCNKITPLSKNIHVFVYGLATPIKDEPKVNGIKFSNIYQIIDANTKKETKDNSLFYSKESSFSLSYIMPLSKSDSTNHDNGYESFSYTIPSVITLLSKPYEVEFPVFYASYKDSDYDASLIYSCLRDQLQEKANIHDVSSLDRVNLGLFRISIDLIEGVQDTANYKLRLFLDDYAKTVAIVPMATGFQAPKAQQCFDIKAIYKDYKEKLDTYYFSLEKEKTVDDLFYKLLRTDTQARFNQFASSFEFGLCTMSILKEFFDLTKLSLSNYDTGMLFGKDFANKIQQIPFTVNKDFAIQSQESVSEAENVNTYFNESLTTNSSQKECMTRDDIFIEFFNKINSDKSTNVIKANPSYPYLRLRQGPSFREMLNLFKEGWNKRLHAKYTSEECRSYLSRILDDAIDAGSLVPTFNLDGERIYRSGEAPQYNKKEYQVFLSYYKKQGWALLEYPWDYKLENLDEKYQREVRNMLIFVAQ